MPESVQDSAPNLDLVELPGTIPVTERVGGESTKPVLVIQRDGRAFRRCHACGRLRRPDPEDSQ